MSGFGGSDGGEDRVVGVFVGLDSSSLEYLASIIAPYQHHYAPEVGAFMLIDNGPEYLVARVMDYVPKGELMTFMGEKWLAEVALHPEVIGQDLKRKKVSYRVKVKLLGRVDKKSQEFTPGIRKIPHITSRVVQPNREQVRAITRQALSREGGGIEIGSYWLDPAIPVQFDVGHLVGKRTFIFARAGYGKSNLMKVLASNWKPEHGSIVIFDPEGEYSVTDKKGRPGIMDEVPAILVTNRARVKQELRGANVYDKLKFNLKRFHPGFIVPILVAEAKHETVFFSKLMSLSERQWHALVDLVHEGGWGTSRTEISVVLREGQYEETEEVSVQPIINNLVGPIKKLHDPDSRLIDVILQATREGVPVILDISLLDSHTSLQFASTIVSHFFHRNQRMFTGGEEDLSRVVFVVEEAQSVIGGKTNVSRFVELAKEGRKYQLGGVFITQQPASISPEILSQGDNFFVFHMLSKGDLKALQVANAHFSTDVLTQVLNEPIPGKGYMWTSHQPFVLPVQVANFEDLATPNRAPELQGRDRVLDRILARVVSLEGVYEELLRKLRDVAAGFGVEPWDDQKFHEKRDNELVVKSKITVELFKLLDGAQREFLRKEGALQEYNGRVFAVTFKYVDKMWGDLKGLPP
ncbi:MAG: ATP-binding protein [Promethearchaeota archaeon]